MTILIIPALGSSPSPREVHFAIVLDAGSSGTRAYLYRWSWIDNHDHDHDDKGKPNKKYYFQQNLRYFHSWPEHSGDRHELLKISPLLQVGFRIIIIMIDLDGFQFRISHHHNLDFIYEDPSVLLLDRI